MSPAQIYCLQLQNRSVDNNNNNRNSSNSSSNCGSSSNGGSNNSNSNAAVLLLILVASAAWAFCKVPTATRRGPDSCTPTHTHTQLQRASKRMQHARWQRPRLCCKCNGNCNNTPHLKLKQPPIARPADLHATATATVPEPAFLIEKPTAIYDFNAKIKAPTSC